MKKILTFIILSLLSTQVAFANTIKIVAKHKGHDGLTLLADRDLFIQVPLEKSFYVKTNHQAIFELQDKFAANEIRAYLVSYNGSVLAGCFSNFVPAYLGEVILKGIDCQ